MSRELKVPRYVRSGDTTISDTWWNTDTRRRKTYIHDLSLFSNLSLSSLKTNNFVCFLYLTTLTRNDVFLDEIGFSIISRPRLRADPVVDRQSTPFPRLDIPKESTSSDPREVYDVLFLQIVNFCRYDLLYGKLYQETEKRKQIAKIVQ